MPTEITIRNSIETLAEAELEPGQLMIIQTREKALGLAAILIRRTPDDSKTIVQRVTESRHVKVADHYAEQPTQEVINISDANLAKQQELEISRMLDVAPELGRLSVQDPSMLIRTASRIEGHLTMVSVKHS